MNENFEVTSLKKEWLKDIAARFEEYKKDNHIGRSGKIEIYTDYRDREAVASLTFLKDIFDNYNPKEAFEEKIEEWEEDYAWQSHDDLIRDLKSYCSDKELEFWEENEGDVNELIFETFYYGYNVDDFNVPIKVNIMVDCGNANMDYTSDDFSYYGHRGYVPEESSLLWLANQQGKGDEFKDAVSKWYRDDGEYVNREVESDKFIESMIQEVENLPSNIGTLTFIVEMKLFDLFKCIGIQQQEYDPHYKYEPQLNDKAKSYIVLDKKTMCGLFNSWDGGGSVLEIKLDKDVELPLKYCKFAVDGCHMQGRWDVNEVYGLIGSCWKETVKEIKKVG